MENLSWRLWYRECQLLEREKHASGLVTAIQTTRTKKSRPQESKEDAELPALSSSVESIASDVEDEDILDRDAGRLPPHLTPDRFHELVTQFGQEGPHLEDWKVMANSDTIAPAETNICIPTSTASTAKPQETPASSSLKPGSLNTLNVQALRRASSVVHGFNPNLVSTKISPVREHTSPMAVPTNETGSRNMFFIESSPSDSEHESNSMRQRNKKKGSMPKSALLPSASIDSNRPPVKKHTSFREIVDECSGYDSSPFDSDSEDDGTPAYANESAIVSDDEFEEGQTGDEDEWDSVVSESRCNSLDGNNFDKVSSLLEARPTLTSQKSILSDLLTNPMTRLSTAHSKSSPAIAQSKRSSPQQSPSALRNVIPNELPSSRDSTSVAMPTAIKGTVSPRTTRRNMLATELSESLRRHLLWERKQKSTSTNVAVQALLQRRHTAVDLTKIAKNATPVSVGPASVDKMEGADNEFGYNGAGW